MFRHSKAGHTQTRLLKADQTGLIFSMYFCQFLSVILLDSQSACLHQYEHFRLYELYLISSSAQCVSLSWYSTGSVLINLIISQWLAMYISMTQSDQTGSDWKGSENIQFGLRIKGYTHFYIFYCALKSHGITWHSTQVEHCKSDDKTIMDRTLLPVWCHQYMPGLRYGTITLYVACASNFME